MNNQHTPQPSTRSLTHTLIYSFRGLPALSLCCGLWCGALACSDEPNFELLNPQMGGDVVARAGVEVSGGQSAGVMSAGVMSAGVMSAGQEVAGVMSAGQEVAGVMSAGVSAGAESGTTAGDEPPPLATSALEGRWLSVGADLSPILSDPSVDITRLDARFNSDMSFEVEVTNGDGFTFELAGTYSLTPAPNSDLTQEGITHQLTLSQTFPEASTSEGLWRVEGDLLTYEVVQVQPPLPGGQTPPTPAGGFGSTNNGALGDDNVQRYRRQP